MKRNTIIGLLALGLGCNLESALGVDGDGSTSGEPTTTRPQTNPAAEASGSSSSGVATEDAADESTTTGPPPSACDGREVRVATYNIESVGGEGSTSFEAVVDVLLRIDADIVCMQEVHEEETASLFALGTAAGYPDVIQASRSPAIGGELTNACMSRPGLSLVGSFSGDDLSSDPQANDVGRDILVVQADLAGEGEPPCRLGVVALHLKSGQVQLDWFRRQIEAERVAQAVALYRESYPNDPMVILGDLNESLDDPALGSVFDEIPFGLPDSYSVGDDIAFPLLYDHFLTFMGLGFSIADATQEDSEFYETWADLVRLDYVLYADAEMVEAEVYNACRDNGVDDGPVGGSIAKAGDPLECFVSDEASDHFPVVVDLTLP